MNSVITQVKETPLPRAEAREKLLRLRGELTSRRFVTEPVFGDPKIAAETLDKLRAASRRLLTEQKKLLAICAVGSRVFGTATDESDIDIVYVSRQYHDLITSQRTEEVIPADSFSLTIARETGLEVDRLHQTISVRMGLYENGETDLELFIKFRLFVLAATGEYFDRMSELLRNAKSKIESQSSRFQEHMRNVWGDYPTPLTARGLFVRKMQSRTGLDLSEVREIFNDGFWQERKTQGIADMGRELEFLRVEKEQLAK